MKQFKRTSLAVAILAACAANASAQDGGPQISISGFGSAILTATNTDKAEFARPNQAAGVKEDPRFGPDSNFGVQATATFNDRLSLTAQGLVRKNATDQFGAEVSWAFAKYKLNDDFSVRVGRVGVPIYMISDYRYVGYASTMIRPPAELYRQVTADYIDGADITYNHSYGDTTVTAQLGYGNSRSDVPGGYYVDYKKAYALQVVVERGPFTVRFGRASADVTMVNNTQAATLLATLSKVGYASAANDYKIAGVKGTFTSLGGTMDYQNFIVQAEYAKRDTDSRFLMDTTAWYAMGGYRLGKFTPYVMHATLKQDNARHYTGVPAVGPLLPLAAALDAAGQSPLQTSNAIGLRWDFAKSAAFKVQIDRIEPKDGAGAFLKPAAGFTGPVNVYAAGVDFVF
ncbi:porin [Massilia arenosa]|uniref:Porin n=1 Tax=Zemynaea arenosa TaxID=2561931 RepID=A0A4Y9SLB3_9BURK|nr:porin [Massilia arenosa]TFW22439.1 porin [Massilia arenosa]